MNNNYECPICMNELLKDSSNNYINFAVTNCGHKFCLSCIIRYGKRHNICPLCRNEFLDPYNFSPRAFHRPRQSCNGQRIHAPGAGR